MKCEISNQFDYVRLPSLSHTSLQYIIFKHVKQRKIVGYPEVKIGVGSLKAEFSIWFSTKVIFKAGITRGVLWNIIACIQGDKKKYSTTMLARNVVRFPWLIEKNLWHPHRFSIYEYPVVGNGLVRIIIWLINYITIHTVLRGRNRINIILSRSGSLVLYITP